MATNLISLFKKAKKNDSFRAAEQPVKYNNSIAQLNSLGSDQYSKLTSTFMQSFGRTNSSLENRSTSDAGGPLPKK